MQFVVAVNQKEAEELAKVGFGHDTKKQAEDHLKEVKAPPTDSFYANQYKIYKVN